MSSLKLITVRYSARLNGFDTTALDDFLRDKELLQVREYYYEVDHVPHLTLLIFYTPGETIRSRTETKDGYKSLLTDTDWPLFRSLKEWRNNKAKTKGIPPYIIFDNRQLALIAHHRPCSKAALQKIEGIGLKKTEDYWEEIKVFLEKLPAEEASLPSEEVKDETA